MDWMYKEHARNEESSADMNKQSPTSDSLTNLGDAVSFVCNQTDGMMGSIHGGNLSAQPTLLMHEDGNAEDELNVMGLETSDFNEFNARSMDLKQPQGNKYVHESVCEASNISIQDGLDETTSMKCGVPVDGVEKVVEEVCEETSNKDKVVKLLREEVRYIKR